jgi:hypothetical protein
MENNGLINVWEEGNDKLLKKEKLMETEIRTYLQPGIRKATFNLQVNLWLFNLVQLANIVLISMNFPGYSSNINMMVILSGMLLVSLFILFYGLYIFHRYRMTDLTAGSLTEALAKKIRFMNHSYEAWLLMIPLSAIFLALSLNFLVDNMGGVYPVYHPWAIVGGFTGMYVFIYGAQRIAYLFSFRQLKIYLSDLENQVTEGSRRIQRMRRKYFWLFLVIGILLLAALVLSALKAKSLIP